MIIQVFQTRVNRLNTLLDFDAELPIDRNTNSNLFFKFLFAIFHREIKLVRDFLTFTASNLRIMEVTSVNTLTEVADKDPSNALALAWLSYYSYNWYLLMVFYTYHALSRLLVGSALLASLKKTTI